MIIIDILTIFLMLIAFTLLAQSMPRHSKQIWRRVLSDQANYFSRILGWCLLLISLIALCYSHFFTNALLLWLGYCTLSALLLILLLSYQPQWLQTVLLPLHQLGHLLHKYRH